LAQVDIKMKTFTNFFVYLLKFSCRNTIKVSV